MANVTFKSIWDTLYPIDCNGHIEEKVGGRDNFGNNIKLKYLSWTWAWKMVMEKYPDSSYEIRRFGDHLYNNDPLLGIMVETTVTIGGNSRSMWLPVMDSSNNAQKQESYSYKTRNGERTVGAADMMGINKALMRCLVKNLAMFGLGLHIYAGEDLPEGTELEVKPEAKPEAKAKITEKAPRKPQEASATSSRAPSVKATEAWKAFLAHPSVKLFPDKEARNSLWKDICYKATKKVSPTLIQEEEWDLVISYINKEQI